MKQRRSCLGHKHPCWFLVSDDGGEYCSACFIEKTGDEFSSIQQELAGLFTTEAILSRLTNPSVEYAIQSIAHTERIENVLSTLLSKGGEYADTPFDAYMNHIRDTHRLQTPLILRIRSHTEGAPMCAVYQAILRQKRYLAAILPVRCLACIDAMVDQLKVEEISRELRRFLESETYTTLVREKEARARYIA